MVPGGSFLPNPIKPSRSRSSKQKDSAQGAVAVSIELRTPSDALKEKRQKEAYPVILQFEKWMYETVTHSSQDSRIGKTISYTLPLLPRLSRYVNDGRFCIDNNLVENAIRPLALGRKNFLFCGNHDAAIRAAIVYSLVDS